MFIKGNVRKVRMVGNGRRMSIGSYKKMRGDGVFDVLKSIFSGGIKAVGSLFRSSGAKQLAQKVLTTGKDLAKNAVKEGVQSLVKDVSTDPLKYVNKGVELVNKFKENPQDVAKVEAQKFGKQILNIAKEKVIKPTIDQYREEFEGVKEKAKSDVQSNLGNLISGMGLLHQKKQRGKGALSKAPKTKPTPTSNKKIMNHLRGCGLVPL
jgi:hypothetical protein